MLFRELLLVIDLPQLAFAVRQSFNEASSVRGCVVLRTEPGFSCLFVSPTRRLRAAPLHSLLHWLNDRMGSCWIEFLAKISPRRLSVEAVGGCSYCEVGLEPCLEPPQALLPQRFSPCCLLPLLELLCGHASRHLILVRHPGSGSPDGRWELGGYNLLGSADTTCAARRILVARLGGYDCGFSSR